MARVQHEEELDAVINAVFGGTPRAELIKRLQKAGVAYGAVNSCGGLREHPALRRLSVQTPNGPVESVAPPYRFNKQERAVGPVPDVGEHSKAIRAEFGDPT